MSSASRLPLNDWPPQPVLDWIFSSGHLLADSNQFVQQLADQLVACGAPVDRLQVTIRTLNPEIVGSSDIWQKSSGETRHLETGRRIQVSDSYLGSPMQQLFDTRTNIRQTLNLLPDDAHGAFVDLAQQGFTDYLGLPVMTADGMAAVIILVTCREGGFVDRDVDGFCRLRDYLAPVIEVFSLKHLSRSLLNTYVGKRTGEKVLAGMIGRGDADLINAALWFSDLRNFTHFTETLAADEILRMLNDYFEFIEAAVSAQGGEILRFIGDAMLIVFPIDEQMDQRSACQAALDAALDAHNTLASLNHQRRRHGQPEIEFGVGLNVGEVIYGNVGAPGRLDFTVMGPAVNRSARLESLTSELQRKILFSSEFAELISEPSVSLGNHRMKGIAEPQPVFGLADGN